MKKQLHPNATWYFRIGVYSSFIFLIIFLFFFSIAFVSDKNLDSRIPLLNYIFYGLVGLIIVIIIFGEIYARMAYNRWFYEFSESGVRLERGIIWKRYSNIPYDRIQNVDITRGIIARIFGFSTVMIQTAGYSVPNKNMVAEGYIPAVSISEAENIQKLVMKHISKKGIRQGL